MFTLKFQGWEGGDLVLSTDSDSMQMSWSPFSGGGGGVYMDTRFHYVSHAGSIENSEVSTL